MIKLYLWITRKTSVTIYKDTYINVILNSDGTVVYALQNGKQQIRICDEPDNEILIAGHTNRDRGYIRFNADNGIKTTIISNEPTEVKFKSSGNPFKPF